MRPRGEIEWKKSALSADMHVSDNRRVETEAKEQRDRAGSRTLFSLLLLPPISILLSSGGPEVGLQNGILLKLPCSYLRMQAFPWYKALIDLDNGSVWWKVGSSRLVAIISCISTASLSASLYPQTAELGTGFCLLLGPYLGLAYSRSY